MTIIGMIFTALGCWSFFRGEYVGPCVAVIGFVFWLLEHWDLAQSLHINGLLRDQCKELRAAMNDSTVAKRA